jgi:hypothetical protein
MAKDNETALDRLNRLNEQSNEREFTLEEQMDSVSTDEFLDGMSLAAKSQMSHLVEEVTLNEDEQSNTEETLEEVGTVIDIPKVINEDKSSNDSSNDSEELFNINNKPKRQYNHRNKSEENTNTKVDVDAKDNASNPVFDQVVKDLIDDLRKRNYKINRFDDKSMAMIFDYVYSKF